MKTPGARTVPEAVAEEIVAAVGRQRSGRLEERLMEAASAFERERYRDARRDLRELAEQVPGVPAVRELYGLTLYRLGRWAEAAKELEAYRSLSGSVDQHPVLADCYRALKRFAKVQELWGELRAASPAPEVLTEGRIVAAGALADQGRVREAIELLERSRPKLGKLTKPKDHHQRAGYALADLYERAGDFARARELFRSLANAAPGFADVAERLAALG